ncbi:ATP-binding cassette domain-containing protein [Botrimarina hoheduenensis]|uniref:Daunorubicin/doxorubicin resistance ATP-binding protein DrrA n=1 Tax=Botrimarina hoheduenensis TaxID=2528000 RepID=A0A5C5VNK5_9BACT|nr:ATP-binding cassette domain-containing protein [Botrimarina hoheduenensis]TWT40266.1 Daunorubicin/doxorubicin resistance ATP-binding protein DrrA [Botrimarina hoheduenensis]
MIEVVGLTKVYPDLAAGDFKAVDRVSFTASSGEAFGLLGPNGAGKTTVLRILTTLLKPTSGVSLVNGFDCVRQEELVRNQIGFISVGTAVYDRMTAWEFVEYFGQLHGMNGPKLHERMEWLFDKLGMQDLRDTLGGKMSTGMKQKTSIARALVHDPPVIIFDEATNGLDAFAARASLKIVSELRDAGKCVIFSTHIMSEVERLCDRIAVMSHGRIVDTGTPEELCDRHGENDLEELFFRLATSEPSPPADALSVTGEAAP